MADEHGGRDRGVPDGGFPTRVQETGAGADADLLETRRRRETLRVLSRRRLLRWLDGDEDGAASQLTLELSELVDMVAEQERAVPGRAVEDRRQHRRSVAASLRCEHLPALDEAGVVEHDETADAVTYHGDPEVDAALSLTE